MPPRARGKEKSSSKSSTSPTKSRNAGEPPDPFNKTSAKLDPLLQTLDTKHIYITSIDTKPWDFKAKIFSVPLAMNIVICALIAWRIWAIGPYYLKIFASGLGYPNETTMDVSTMTWEAIAWEIARRTANGLFDMSLYYFIWPWPSDFFLGGDHGSPTFWRVSLGFSDKEITLRRSRRWDEQVGDVVIEDTEKTEGGRVFLANVKAATSRTFMFDRTGYLMMNNEWELDFTGMILATSMVDNEELSFDDMKTTVYVYSKTYGWVTYETQETSDAAREEEGQRKILAFKEKLTAMGKESLFFRWIELMQFESTRPGGFTPERQVEAAAKVKELFESNGVDFEKFWEEIGGMENMPGVDVEVS